MTNPTIEKDTFVLFYQWWSGGSKWWCVGSKCSLTLIHHHFMCLIFITVYIFVLYRIIIVLEVVVVLIKILRW